MDSQVFKEAMRRLAASVCVITAQDDSGPHGCTATAVCSLSAEPPSLLCCLNKTSRTSLAISGARTFAVNVMALPDLEIANILASKLESQAKFATGEWRLDGAAPILGTAHVSFLCDAIDIVDSGTHRIFIGRISDIQLGQDANEALLYADGRYGRFAAHEAKPL